MDPRNWGPTTDALIVFVYRRAVSSNRNSKDMSSVGFMERSAMNRPLAATRPAHGIPLPREIDALRFAPCAQQKSRTELGQAIPGAVDEARWRNSALKGASKRR